MTDEERTTAGGQQQRSDGEDDRPDKPKKEVAKSKSMYGAGIKSRMSIGRSSRRSITKRPATDGEARQPLVAAIAGEAAVALDDLRDDYYHDLRSTVRPPDADTVAAGNDGGPIVVRDRLRDVRDAMADMERALDAVCESLSAVPDAGCAVSGTVAEWVARWPRSDSMPKPRADRLGMKVYRTRTDGI